MPEEIDLEKRKTVLHRLPLIISGALLLPSSFIPIESRASDSKDKRHIIPDKASLEKLLSLMDYPRNFEFFYWMQNNLADLQGYMVVKRNSESTILKMEIQHPRESKIIDISEERDSCSGIDTYSERDFDTAKNKVMYNNVHRFNGGDKPKTTIGLVEDLINGTLHSQRFVFQGNGISLNEHSLEVKTKDEEDFDLVREAKIEEGSPRVPSLKAYYKSINGIPIPVEIHVDYKIKLNLPLVGWPVYKTRTLIGVLQA